MKIYNFFNLNVKDIFASLFIIFSLIPWVNFGLNSRDSQIWPLLFGMAFLFFCIHRRIPLIFLFPFLIPILAIFSWFFLSDLTLDGIRGFVALRGILSYTGFAICFVAFLYYLRENEFPVKIFIIVNLLYVFVGIAQTLIDPAIVSSIVASRDQTFSSAPFLARGVPGLTPEPTFFGIFLYFISFIYLTFYDFKPPNKIKYLLIINLLTIILLTRSTMILLFLILTIPF